MKALVLLICLIVLFSNSAHADSLFNDAVCPVAEGLTLDIQDARFLMASYGGIRCEDIKSIRSAKSYAGLALMPASFATLRNPAIAAELAAAGLTLTNPAVLSVAVVGAVGVATFYIVLNASIEECDRLEREELKNSIMRELEQKYGLSAIQSNLQLEVNH